MNMSTEDIHEVYQEEVERPGYVLEMRPRKQQIAARHAEIPGEKVAPRSEPAPHNTAAEFDTERFVPFQN
ncbi:MAG: hypothetical protein ABSH28_13900 [Acidobacteriota bacterium]|jgi:hypothetical protein